MSNPYEFMSTGDIYNPKSNQFKDIGINITGRPSGKVHIRSFPPKSESKFSQLYGCHKDKSSKQKGG